MKYLQMKESRENLVGFLHITDINYLNSLFAGLYDVNHKSYYEICDKALELYKESTLQRKYFTKKVL